MLEIIILVLCGKHIASIAKRKNRNPVGYVLLMVGGWYGGAILGAIVGAILGAAAEANEDDFFLFILPFLLLGAACGLGLSYLVVCSVSPLPNRRNEYDDYDDEPRRRRRQDDEYDDHYEDRPSSRRRDEDDEDRPRRRRRVEDDY